VYLCVFYWTAESSFRDSGKHIALKDGFRDRQCLIFVLRVNSIGEDFHHARASGKRSWLVQKR